MNLVRKKRNSHGKKIIDSDIFTNIVGPYTKKVNHDNLQLALKVAALNSFINEKSCKINYKVEKSWNDE